MNPRSAQNIAKPQCFSSRMSGPTLCCMLASHGEEESRDPVGQRTTSQIPTESHFPGNGPQPSCPVSLGHHQNSSLKHGHAYAEMAEATRRVYELRKVMKRDLKWPLKRGGSCRCSGGISSTHLWIKPKGVCSLVGGAAPVGSVGKGPVGTVESHILSSGLQAQTTGCKTGTLDFTHWSLSTEWLRSPGWTDSLACLPGSISSWVAKHVFLNRHVAHRGSSASRAG